MIRYVDGDPTINEFNEFLKQYGIYFAIGFAVLVLLVVLALVFYSLHKKKQITSAKEEIHVDNSIIIEALGGNDNIKSHSINGSRIVLELNDYSKVDEKVLNDNGVASIIKMSNKITLVIKGDSNSFYKQIF